MTDLPAEPTDMARCLAAVDALNTVIDPELGMSVNELMLIRHVSVVDGALVVKMILTTPFCPYAGPLMEEVRAAAAAGSGLETRVELLAERWDPVEAGLAW